MSIMTRSRHRAEAFQIEAQAGPGSGIPPAKMSQRVSLSDGEGLLPSLCSDEPRAERMDQRVRQRSTHRVCDFVFARFARPVFARPNLWCMIFIHRERHGVIEPTELVRGGNLSWSKNARQRSPSFGIRRPPAGETSSRRALPPDWARPSCRPLTTHRHNAPPLRFAGTTRRM